MTAQEKNLLQKAEKVSKKIPVVLTWEAKRSLIVEMLKLHRKAISIACGGK